MSIPTIRNRRWNEYSDKQEQEMELVFRQVGTGDGMSIPTGRNRRWNEYSDNQEPEMK